ncbi:MAG: hypothetical protein VX871_00460 [Pseudomonadota bacterium]|nr:hypothetical protein [Pseudomonadota bacterium]
MKLPILSLLLMALALPFTGAKVSAQGADGAILIVSPLDGPMPKTSPGPVVRLRINNGLSTAPQDFNRFNTRMGVSAGTSLQSMPKRR